MTSSHSEVNDEYGNDAQVYGDKPQTRHKVAIDTLSLLDDDGETPSAEEIVEGQQMFFDIIRSLSSEREKFIAICLYDGFNKQEIADMLCVHPSRVTRNTQDMQKKLLIMMTSKARK